MNNDEDYWLDAAKIGMTDNEGLKCYITIVLKDKEPYEVFFTFEDENNQDLQNKYANVTCITRFISKCLSYDVPMTEVLAQLKRSSYNKNDVPDLLRQALTKVANINKDLSLNGKQAWTNDMTSASVSLPVGVPAGDGWSKVQTT